jgi:transposase
LYDHQPERQWRHLDTCQYRTILHADPPRTQCPTNGVRVVKLPSAEPSSRFTAMFEALAIAWLKAASQKAVADQLGLSWDEIHGIMERAVKRGLARRQAEPIRHLGVDEKPGDGGNVGAGCRWRRGTDFISSVPIPARTAWTLPLGKYFQRSSGRSPNKGS